MEGGTREAVAFRTALDHAEFKQRFLAMSFTPGDSIPEAFDKMIRSGIDTFVRMAKLEGLRAK